MVALAWLGGRSGGVSGRCWEEDMESCYLGVEVHAYLGAPIYLNLQFGGELGLLGVCVTEGCPHVWAFYLREVLLPFHSFGMADGVVVFVVELVVVLVEGWVR
jgi:hypothetical protein